MGLMVPGVLLAGVKNTVGTGEIEILGLGIAGLTGEPLGVMITGNGVGLLATGWGGAAFWQPAKMLTRLKNTPDLKKWDIERKSRIDLVEKKNLSAKRKRLPTHGMIEFAMIEHHLP